MNVRHPRHPLGLEICYVVADCIAFKQWTYCLFLQLVGVGG